MAELTEEVRTYEITCAGGVFRIEVPASARVSYGPIVSAAGKPSYGGNALRIWQGTKATEVQRALFNDVTSFRDLSLPMKVRAVRMFGQEDWWLDDGSWTGRKADLVERDWMDADQIKPRPPEANIGGFSDPTKPFVPLSKRGHTSIATEEDEAPF